MEICDIPVEVLVYIFLQVDGKTLGICRRVCTQWKNIIHASDHVWENHCGTEFPHASKIAKEKSHSACKWYHIYRNLRKWSYNANLSSENLKLMELDFSVLDFIKDLYVVPLPLHPSNNKKLTFANNVYALILFYREAIVVVRPVDNEQYKSETYFQAMGFSLYKDKLYFFYDKKVFICDLISPELTPTCILISDYQIKAIKHTDGKTYVFTNNGNILILSKGNVSKKTIQCPPEFIYQIKYISAIDDNNYICYSRNLFDIVLGTHVNLYLEFNEVTALFLYGHFVLMAERSGSILIYRINEKKLISKQRMSELVHLPEGHYALHLDVFERKAGPVVIATTLTRIFLVEISFFPEWELNLADYELSNWHRLATCWAESEHEFSTLDKGLSQVIPGGPEGASVPSLGLSNKAVFSGDDNKLTEEDSDGYFVPVDLTEPPTEETLMQNTLWPEHQKLYGHGYEVYALAASGDSMLLASTCKATDAEHAAVLLWETKSWTQIQRLVSHSLTVTQVEFSTDSRRLLSVSRDRRWSLFQRRQGSNLFDMVAHTDKTNGVHARIIWCCAWAYDGVYFGTGSRDGKVCVWTKTDITPAPPKSSLGAYALLGAPLELSSSSVTALAFAPILLEGSRIIAVGLESGVIRLYSFEGKWSLSHVMDTSAAHHLTVKRLAFKPQKQDVKNKQALLASCGTDNLVRLHCISLL